MIIQLTFSALPWKTNWITIYCGVKVSRYIIPLSSVFPTVVVILYSFLLVYVRLLSRFTASRLIIVRKAHVSTIARAVFPLILTSI